MTQKRWPRNVLSCDLAHEIIMPHSAVRGKSVVFAPSCRDGLGPWEPGALPLIPRQLPLWASSMKCRNGIVQRRGLARVPWVPCFAIAAAGSHFYHAIGERRKMSGGWGQAPRGIDGLCRHHACGQWREAVTRAWDHPCGGPASEGVREETNPISPVLGGGLPLSPRRAMAYTDLPYGRRPRWRGESSGRGGASSAHPCSVAGFSGGSGTWRIALKRISIRIGFVSSKN